MRLPLLSNLLRTENVPDGTKFNSSVAKSIVIIDFANSFPGIMVVSIRLFALIPMNAVLSFILQILIGIIVYLLTSIITRDKTFKYVLDIARSFLKKGKKGKEITK